MQEIPENVSKLQRWDETVEPLIGKVLEGPEGKYLAREKICGR